MAIGGRSREEPPVAQWRLPVKGVVSGIQDLEIPDDGLYSASNIELTKGYVQGRRGLTALDAQLFGATPVAALNFWASASAGWLVTVTTNKIWTKELSSGTWTDRSGSLTGTIDDPARAIQFEFGTPSTNRVYVCNGVNNLKTWKPGDATASDVTGSPPVFKDICVVGDRICGLVGTHEFRWGEPLTDSNWPALNSKLFTETASPAIACRNLGAVGLVVYKKDAIWQGDLTGLAGANAFRFSPVEKVEGPAGPSAVVDADGNHFYMTRTGRIHMYNGFMSEWVADGVWEVVKAEIDSTKPNRIHGVYIRQLNQVWFFYKRTGSTDTDGLVILNIIQKRIGLPYAAFPGRMGKSITTACTMDDDSFNTALVFSNNTGAEKTYKLEGVNDDGVAISSHMQTGLQVPAKFEVARALSLEALLERSGGYGSITAKLVSSNILDSIGGTLSAGQTIDLTSVPVKNPIGFDVRGRFLGLRFEWTSTATVRYRAAMLRGMETTG